MTHPYRPDNPRNFNVTGTNNVPTFPVPFPPNLAAPSFHQYPPPRCTPPLPNSIAPPMFGLPPPPRGIQPSVPSVFPPPTNIPPPVGIAPPTCQPPPCQPPPSQQPTDMQYFASMPPRAGMPPSSIPPPPLPFFPPPNFNACPPPVMPLPSASEPIRQPNFVPQFNIGPSPYLQVPRAQVINQKDSFVAQPSPTSQWNASSMPVSLDDAKDSSISNKVENEDELWLKNWLVGRQLKKSPESKTNEITVCKARSLLGEALQALADLKVTTNFLRNSTSVDEELWRVEVRKAMQIKEKLRSLMKQFSSETVQTLKRLLRKKQAKRARLRRQRLQAVENQKLVLKERESLHSSIDDWRNAIQDNVINEKKREELKNEADNILSEVRKKLQEARKVLDQLDVLERLRAARLENCEKKGLKVSSASTEYFEATVAKLRNLMKNQLSVYEAEERALKVMLEAEREQEKHDKQQQLVGMFKNCQKETLECLFGEPPDQSSPLFFYWQYYMQGHSDLNALVQIRHQWDVFLVAEDEPSGSPIPLGWVTPKPPSSSQWETALESIKQ